MSQNVRTKTVRMTISLLSKDKIRRDKRVLCREKTAHHIAQTHGRSRAKGSHRRDGRSRRFQTVVGSSTSHAPACLKSANNTAKICLSDPGYIGNMPQIL